MPERIALAATGIFLTLVTAGLIVTQTISPEGTVAVSTVDLSVFTNSQCTQNCASATLTLSAAADIGDITNFNIIITGTE